jgi:hypothetical protein
LFATDRLALRLPAAAGVKLIATLQLPPGATLPLALQVLAAPIANSAAWAPVSDNDDSTSAALPELLIVTACVAEVAPTTCVKLSAPGLIEATGASATPVPLKATVDVLGEALCVKVSVPPSAPADVG